MSGRPHPSQSGRFSGAMTEDLLTLISGWVHKMSVASSRVVGLRTPSHMAIHNNPDSTNMRYFYMCKTSVSKCFPQYLRFSTLTAGGKRDICRDVQQIRRYLVMQEGLSVWLQTISKPARLLWVERMLVWDRSKIKSLHTKISQYKGKSLHLVLRREYWAMGALILLRWCRIHYGTHRSRVLRVAGALKVWPWRVNHP